MTSAVDESWFHLVGPEMEKVRPPASFILVLTVTAYLVLDDLSQLVAVKVLKVCWTLMVKDKVYVLKEFHFNHTQDCCILQV